MTAGLTRMTHEEVLEAIRANRTVENADLKGLDLENAYLHLGRFHGCCLDGASFAGIRMEKTGFKEWN